MLAKVSPVVAQRITTVIASMTQPVILEETLHAPPVIPAKAGIQ